jgi:squalene-hopene/tetraprenyl-beta-curcumene cyclase
MGWANGCCLVLGVLCGLSFVPARGSAQQADVREQYQIMVTKAVSYLATKGRAADGSYSSFSGPAVTALVTTGLIQHGRPPEDPLVAESLQYLKGFIQPDGGVYQPGSNYRNYETCLAILCFSAANRGGRYDDLLSKANEFIRENQWDEGEGQGRGDPAYGGAGYGKSKRPDLSNTSFFVEALKSTETPENRAAIQNALVFISRCQNLESEHNTTEFAAKNPDGGFYYTPAAGGASMAGKTDNGGLRSYGSMTYAGLKSMIYAGLTTDDPRAQAALKWIRKNYDLQSNPGMGDAGVYYYFHTFAKALDALQLETVTDESGVMHVWRTELIQELAKRQQPDGSWINANDRWLEGDPNLVTGYVLLTLSHCKPK